MSLVPSFPSVWNTQIVGLGKLIPDSAATIYAVTARVEKVEEVVAMDKLPLIDEDLWHCGPGGLLKAGTSLGDAIIRSCQKAQQFRRGGFEGPIGVFLLTDGWSKDDMFPLLTAKHWLDYARKELNVLFRLFGFIAERTRPELEKFKAEVGVLPDEDQIIGFKDEFDRTASMILSLTKLQEEITATVIQAIPQHLFAKNAKETNKEPLADAAKQREKAANKAAGKDAEPSQKLAEPSLVAPVTKLR